MKNGVTNKDALHIDDDTMGLIVQNPNYFGIIENYDGVANLLHEKNALLIMNAEGQALSLIKTPGELDADIAVGDLQSLGVPMSFGGAYIGYLATKKKHMRKMPGRICGITKDVDGKRAFVLTLQAREQHIRRAKANSNICSNQSLLALAVTIYMATMGKQGMIDVAKESMKGAHYLYHELLKTNRFEVVYNQPFFKEFVLKANFDVSLFEEDLLKDNILGPLHLGNNHLMFAVTERRSKAEIDQLIQKVVAQP
jgi:glycine dehydrogenase subunit 1